MFPSIFNRMQFLLDKSSSHGGLSEMHVLTSFVLFQRAICVYGIYEEVYSCCKEYQGNFI